MNALLMGKEPGYPLGYTYGGEPPYEAVVIGSLTIGQLLNFADDRVLEALAEGKKVLLYTPGLPEGGCSRGLSAALAAKKRELKSWGIVFTDGAQRKVITAQQARELRMAGAMPGPGAVLTPLAKEILEGSQ